MDDRAALLAGRVAAAASAWLRHPQDTTAYTRLVSAVEEWDAYRDPALLPTPPRAPGARTRPLPSAPTPGRDNTGDSSGGGEHADDETTPPVEQTAQPAAQVTAQRSDKGGPAPLRGELDQLSDVLARRVRHEI